MHIHNIIIYNENDILLPIYEYSMMYAVPIYDL